MLLISASSELTKLKWQFPPTQFENTIFYWDIADKIFSAKSYLNLITKDFFKVGANSSQLQNPANAYQATSDNSGTQMPCILLLPLKKVCDYDFSPSSITKHNNFALPSTFLKYCRVDA